jgi:uncharacterized membrane protein
MKLLRMLRHLFTTRWRTRQCFTPAVLEEIENAIHEVEGQHSGEIRFVVEPALDAADLWANVSPRERALEVFAHLGVWDTERNNGVLIYVLFADHDVEIVADRGIASVVPPEEWQRVCHEIEAHYREGRFAQGSVAGIRGIGRILERHFPGQGADANELPNRPVIL